MSKLAHLITDEKNFKILNDEVLIFNTGCFKVIFTLNAFDSKNKNDIEKICKKYELNFENITSNVQIHSASVRKIDKNEISVLKESDAMITNLKETPLLIHTADCVPIVFLDEKNLAIGVSHAGWRGSYGNIVKNTLDEMKKNYSTQPCDVKAIIGPSIGKCCYNVGDDLIEKFSKLISSTQLMDKYKDIYIMDDDKLFLDLWKVNEILMLDAGLRKENIINLEICTSCSCENFFSYRKNDKTDKRIGTLVQID